MNMLPIIMLLSLAVIGCTTPMTLPASGTWEERTDLLGPVVVCKGGNLSFEPPGCNQWPLSLVGMPAPEIHYDELRAKAADQYHVEAARIILRDVHVDYLAEINGVIRGWKASAVAGRKADTNPTGP